MLNPKDRLSPEEYRRMRGSHRAAVALSVLALIVLAGLSYGLNWHPCLCIAMAMPVFVLVCVVGARAYRCPRCWKHVSGPSSPDEDDSAERCRLPNHCWYCGVKLAP